MILININVKCEIQHNLIKFPAFVGKNEQNQLVVVEN